jgi:hypothetical protein
VPLAVEYHAPDDEMIVARLRRSLTEPIATINQKIILFSDNKLNEIQGDKFNFNAIMSVLMDGFLLLIESHTDDLVRNELAASSIRGLCYSLLAVICVSNSMQLLAPEVRFTSGKLPCKSGNISIFATVHGLRNSGVIAGPS